LLEADIGDMFGIDIDPEQTGRNGRELTPIDHRNMWTQKLSTVIRPALMRHEGVDSRVDLSKDFSIGITEDEDQVVISVVENTFTEEKAAAYAARKQAQLAGRAKSKNKEQQVAPTSSKVNPVTGKKKKPLSKRTADFDDDEI
jgi:hypothetical protein